MPPRCPCCRQPPVRGNPPSKTRPRHTSDTLQPENEIPRPSRWGTFPRPSRISVLGLCSPPPGLWGVREGSLLRCLSVRLKQAGRTEVWDGEGGIQPGQRPVWPGWQREADSTRAMPSVSFVSLLIGVPSPEGTDCRLPRAQEAGWLSRVRATQVCTRGSSLHIPDEGTVATEVGSPGFAPTDLRRTALTGPRYDQGGEGGPP